MSGVHASVPASLRGRSSNVKPSSRVPLAKSAAAVLLLALIPLVAWLTWHGLGGIRPAADAKAKADTSAERANITLERVPTGAGHPTALPAPTASTPPAETASPAQGPKGAVLIKGLGFLTIDDPAADKPGPARAREDSSKPKPVTRVSERPAAPPKGVDPCQDINRKLSTQDPTPEDIAFLKRGCR